MKTDEQEQYLPTHSQSLREGTAPVGEEKVQISIVSSAGGDEVKEEERESRMEVVMEICRMNMRDIHK